MLARRAWFPCLRPLDPQCHIWRTWVSSEIPSEQLKATFRTWADTCGRAQIECSCYPRCYPCRLHLWCERVAKH